MSIRSQMKTESCRLLIGLLALACGPGVVPTQDDSSGAAPLEAAVVRENAYFDSSEGRWICDRGFRESGDSCAPIVRIAQPATEWPMGFDDNTKRAEILAALDSIANHGALVKENSREQDAQMRFLARSLAQDSRDVRRFYDEGRYQRATNLLRRTTENCVVCHTRLLGAEDSPLAEVSVDASVLIEASTGEARAKFQMATRRFDDALDTLEDLLASKQNPATMLGPLTDYLIISIRVKNDYERVLSGLRRFAARPDLWERLRMDVAGWIAALPELRDRARGGLNLETARAMIAEGRAMSTPSEGHAALVHFVVASSILQRLVAAADAPDRDRAEAYYLLGITEARIGRNYWVTAAPFLLESAIRLAPDAPFADEAYALMELEMLMSLEGSDFETLPPEEAQLLEELKRLIDAD